ncbi:endonuclease/exonuclease/phosphatase family protein [Fibrella sp. HMF5335]|uniref:Endonuclease/exonuclease/phosphatase family protein n=1 Tax=Fibrella rubiginis TaxID=2817060 RepID=A0A939GD96_9BACT|nr:endonuclease/exonuclease/phosphatase family protein [Fibrella rubiginis]MBO0935405.1 endonuclease/exonuclease/phosphatase family protein [Fibrella rubiginis]
MTTTDWGWLLYGLLITFLSFVHLVRIEAWWVRIWDFPHSQLAVLAVVGLLGWALFVQDYSWPMWLAPAGLTAALAYQGWLIWPYTPLHPRQVVRQRRPRGQRGHAIHDPNTLRLLSANVLMTNTQCPKVLEQARLHQPDLILILEASHQWARELKPLEADYPYRILCPQENTYGMLFYSKLPIANQQLRFLVEDDIPSIYAQLTLRSGQVVHFYGIHPQPPSPTEHYRSTERDAELVLVGREARQQTEPVLVAGDLNDVAWSHTTRLFQRISGLLDPRVGRGLFSTFHANYFFLRWPLDHVFVSHHFRLRTLRRLPNCGSDHFPILVSLVYHPDPKRATQAPKPEGDDLEEAEGIVERSRE